MATKKNAKDELIAQLTTALSEMRKELDELKQNKNLVKTKKESKKGLPREGVSYDVRGYFKGEQPKQCLLLSKWAFQAAQALGRPVTEPELAGAFETHKDEWRYDQDMWHVWGYYRPRMIGANHVVQIG